MQVLIIASRFAYLAAVSACMKFKKGVSLHCYFIYYTVTSLVSSLENLNSTKPYMEKALRNVLILVFAVKQLSLYVIPQPSRTLNFGACFSDKITPALLKILFSY